MNQFSTGNIVKFVPYTLLDNTYRDISFWIPDEGIRDDNWLRENDFLSVVRDIAGNIVQRVELFDKFQHPKTKRYSRAYRITYEEIDPNVTDPAEFTTHVNEIQTQIIEGITKTLPELTIR